MTEGGELVINFNHQLNNFNYEYLIAHFGTKVSFICIFIFYTIL